MPEKNGDLMLEDALLKLFGQHIKKLRLERGLSQEQFALDAELDRTYVSGIERGKRNVSLINISKLARALKVPMSHLLDFNIPRS